MVSAQEPCPGLDFSYRYQTAVSSLAAPSLATPGGRPHPGPPPWPLYLNSFSLFPRRSRTSQWELKASWGGMPQRMMAFRKAFRWRALKPSTWAGRAAG